MDQRRQGVADKNYVVAASVVAKWVLPVEAYQENALKLKQDLVSGTISLRAPSFLVSEVTNALWQAVRQKRLSEKDSKEAVISLGHTIITFYELNWHHAAEVLDIACKLNVAVYDATYLFLSDEFGMKFITSDTKLFEKVKHAFGVIHLRDYV